MKQIESRTRELPADIGGGFFTVKRYRIDAAYAPLTDEKGREVHGYAIIEEFPPEILGRTLKYAHYTWNVSQDAFGVETIATRNGKSFGAIPRTTRYSTIELAIAGATKSLVQQGKRYGKKYGTAVAP